MQQARQEEATLRIDNRMDTLINYKPTPARANLVSSAYNSGQGNQYFRNPESMRQDLTVYTGGTPGSPGAGRTTGPHSDIVVRDPQGNRIEPGPFMKYLHYQGKPMAETFQMTSPYGPRWGRMHAARDYGTPHGTPLQVVNATPVGRGHDAGGWGDWEEFELNEHPGYTIQVGHLDRNQRGG